MRYLIIFLFLISCNPKKVEYQCFFPDSSGSMFLTIKKNKAVTVLSGSKYSDGSISEMNITENNNDRIVMEFDIGSTQYILFKKTNKLKIQLIAGVQNNILNFNTFVAQCERLN